MLTLRAEQSESLWDAVLPVEVRELPEDLAQIDVLLAQEELLWPIVERWRSEFEQTGRLVLSEGRPTIAMETFVRLMVLKATAGGIGRWLARCRIRCICGASAGLACPAACPTSRRSESSRDGSGPRW